MTTRFTLTLLLGTLSSGAALGQTYPGYDWVPPATATRLQVVQEMARARASGELRSFESMTGPRTASALTRAQVRDEVMRSRASGEHQRLNSEAFAFQTPVIAAVTLGRR